MRETPTREPLFSIIIATYNRAHLLSRAVNSVMNQTYQNFEMIVIDDGSSDNTIEVVEPFKQDNRFVFYMFKENRGTSATRNKGFDLATGDYIALLDSDDELYPEALETAAKAFVDLSPKMVGAIWFDRIDYMTMKITGRSSGKNGLICYEDIVCRRVRGDFWIVVEANVLGNLRLDERIFGYEGLLWLKLIHRTKFYYVAKVLYMQHREHGSTISNDFSIYLKHKEELLLAQEMKLTEHGEAIKVCCPDIYGRELFTLGFAQILCGKRAEGRKTIRKSLRFRLSLQSIVFMLISYVFSIKQVTFLYSWYSTAVFFLGKISQLRKRGEGFHEK